jgi:hypothetical protein
MVVVLGSPGPAEVRERTRGVLSGEFQRELPRAGGAGAGRGGDPNLRNLPPAAPRRERRMRELRLASPMTSFAQVLLWIVVALIVGLSAFWIARELGGYAGDAPASADDDGGARARDGPERRVVERPLGDADELAMRGQYGEAIHVLLLRTLQELAARLPERLPPSLTSREILGRVRMPDDARAALGVLVAQAEVSHFGGRTPDAGDFASCRQHFQRFAQAYLGGQW